MIALETSAAGPQEERPTIGPDLVDAEHDRLEQQQQEQQQNQKTRRMVGAIRDSLEDRRRQMLRKRLEKAIATVEAIKIAKQQEQERETELAATEASASNKPCAVDTATPYWYGETDDEDEGESEIGDAPQDDLVEDTMAVGMPRRMRTRVKFGGVEVRKYAMILGDHPSARQGLPVTLSWEHFDSERHQTLAAYEYVAGKSSSGDNGPKRIKESRRREYLVSLGMYSQREFVECLMSCQEVKQSRLQSAGAENRELLINGDIFGAGAGRALRAAFRFDPLLHAGTVATNTAINASKATSKLVTDTLGATADGVASTTRAIGDAGVATTTAVRDLSLSAARATATGGASAVRNVSLKARNVVAGAGKAMQGPSTRATF